jgi:histidinol-phosphatase (PHP family)
MDYHSHHWRCGHAAGELAEYVAAARSIGLSAFGLSDHNPAWWSDQEHPHPRTYMPRSALSGYLAEARALQQSESGSLSLSIGLEIDWIDGREADLARFLEPLELDYALGSVHYTGGRSIFDARRWESDAPEDVFSGYYAQIERAARSGLFDILSHLTAVEAYAPPEVRPLAEKHYPGVADAVAEGGCLVEINSSGYRKMGGDEPFPNRAMLRLLVERGVGLAFGSDCHSPDEVTFGAERVALLLSELGVTAPPLQEAGPVRGYPLFVYRP